MALPRGGIECHALTQFRRGARLFAAVPERHAEMVVRVRRIRPKGDRAFEVTDGRWKISLLAQRKAEQRVRVCVLVIETKRLFELVARAAQIAPAECVL